MSPGSKCATLLAVVAYVSPAFAQSAIPVDSPTDETRPVEEAVANRPKLKLEGWSADLLDPTGRSSLHLLSRGMMSDGRGVVSAAAAWAFEARARVRLTEGIAISAVLPLALRSGAPGVATHVFFGNVALGGSIGGVLSEGPGARLRLAGGLDVYIPTAAEPEDEAVLVARLALPAMRAYEPQLFVPQMFSARVRAHFDLTAGPFTGEVELGLVPGYRLDGDGMFALLFSAAARTSLYFDSVVPYLEVGTSPQIAGKGEIAPPLLITPGVRFHLADSFDPAIFLSFNFIESSAVIVGVDLAHAFRPAEPKKRELRDREEREDFMDF